MSMDGTEIDIAREALGLGELDPEQVFDKYYDDPYREQLLNIFGIYKNEMDQEEYDEIDTYDLLLKLINKYINSPHKYETEDEAVAEYFYTFFRYSLKHTYDHLISLCLTDNELERARESKLHIQVTIGHGNDSTEVECDLVKAVEIDFDTYTKIKNITNTIGYARDLYEEIAKAISDLKIFIVGTKKDFEWIEDSFSRKPIPITFESVPYELGVLGRSFFKFDRINVEIKFIDSNPKIMDHYHFDKDKETVFFIDRMPYNLSRKSQASGKVSYRSILYLKIIDEIIEENRKNY